MDETKGSSTGPDESGVFPPLSVSNPIDNTPTDSPTETDEQGAAVVYDPTERRVSVLKQDEVGGAGEGECIHLDDRLITILSIHSSIDEAEAEAKKKAADMSTVMNTDVRLNGLDGEASSTPDDEEMDDICLADLSRFNDENIDRYADSEQPIDYENQDAIRALMEVMFQQLNEDILRLNQRQSRLRQLIDRYLGGKASPGGLDAFRMHSTPQLSNGWGPKRPRRSMTGEEENDWDNGGRYGGASSSRRAYPDSSTQYPPLPSYPFISQEEELDCISKSNGSASEYSRRVAKILFADTLHLYFKDQDVKKRQWIHQAVDIRFPSRDRQAQASKWKNCSGAINKNRQSEDTPAPPSREIDYIYVTKDDEEEIFKSCHEDPTKYAELLGMKLFEGTLDRMFRDQDAVRKEWLRECVDCRFPVGDKLKRDGRWKVCASAVNRNRNKAVDTSTGNAIAYPYISQEIEEKCYGVAKDNVALYAELLGRLLFSNTRNIMFKDQDPKVRQWVHDIIDQRYPTPDKLRHSAKWKTCSSAINKARFTADYPMPWDHGKAKSTLQANQTTSEPSTSTTVTTPLSISTASPSSTVSKQPSALSPLRNTRRSTRDGNRSEERKPRNRTGLIFPFISEEEEYEIFDASGGNVQTYARKLAKTLFKDSLELYFKDQDPKRREWLRMLVDHRYPSSDKMENVQKWKSCSGAINKNRTNK